MVLQNDAWSPYSVRVETADAPLEGVALSAFVNGISHNATEGGGLQCSDWEIAPGNDSFGSFDNATKECVVAAPVGRSVDTTGRVRVRFSWRAYRSSFSPTAGSGEVPLLPGEGRLVAAVEFPDGANGTAAPANANANAMLAPFPAFRAETCDQAGLLCYGGGMSRMRPVAAGNGGILSPSVPAPCFGLGGGGPVTLLWSNEDLAAGTGLSALVVGAASAFHLSAHQLFFAATRNASNATDQQRVWGFGCGGEILNVPPGFAQEVLLVHSSRGVAEAWDAWGVAQRRRHRTTKKAEQDPFVTMLSVWTDNGASTMGTSWDVQVGDPAPDDSVAGLRRLGLDVVVIALIVFFVFFVVCDGILALAGCRGVSAAVHKARAWS